MLPQASIEHMWGLQKSMLCAGALLRGGAPASMANTNGSVDVAGSLGATEAGPAAAGQCKEAMPCQ